MDHSHNIFYDGINSGQWADVFHSDGVEFLVVEEGPISAIFLFV